MINDPTAFVFGLMYLIGFGISITLLITTLRHFTNVRQNLGEIQSKLYTISESTKEVNNNLKVVESKIGDLTMRVNITEVRLEERRPQQFSVPHPVQPISIERKKPGRKPKALV